MSTFEYMMKDFAKINAAYAKRVAQQQKAIAELELSDDDSFLFELRESIERDSQAHNRD